MKQADMCCHRYGYEFGFIKSMYTTIEAASNICADQTVHCICHNITQTRPCNKLQFFHSCENDNFQMKFFDSFLIFAQNIDCGYTLEPPH